MRKNYHNSITKRVLDLVISFVGILLLAPTILMISVVIAFDSKGPVFYRGLRSGKQGKVFRIIKFRTMVTEAEKLGGFTTGTNDFRVTKVGKVLRRTKLDELPQLINVLIGEMSIVGPRPEVLFYTEKYSVNEACILSVRPGITDDSSIEFIGLDQLVGDENPDEYYKKKILPKKNLLRIEYVKNATLANDIRIIFKTLFRVYFRLACINEK